MYNLIENKDLSSINDKQLINSVKENNKILSNFEKVEKEDRYKINLPGGLNYKYFVDLDILFRNEIRKRSLDNLID